MNTPVRRNGRIRSWKDERGFGFITPSGGGEEVFAHISAFVNRSRRPTGNEAVTYEMRTDARGRPQASRVRFAGDRTRQSTPGTIGVVYAIAAAGTFLSVVASSVAWGKLPSVVLTVYLSASAVAFVAYAWDKFAARNNRWRTSESTLHLLGLSGGWPGALVARHALRHKSQKQPFVVTFWVTVVLNIVALGWFLSPTGQTFLESILGQA